MHITVKKCGVDGDVGIGGYVTENQVSIPDQCKADGVGDNYEFNFALDQCNTKVEVQ